ncbi:hypothetical protein ABZ351_28785 [Streptomyces microflavus]|uniref:hypothetical protein n=1 Tax=Streptomyces microflavus TaxID=1919 RepID=UPI0033E38A2A
MGSDNHHSDHVGITGLTVDGIRGSTMELAVPGRNCRLTLSGLPGRGWKELLDRAEHLQRDGHGGRPPVWSRPGSDPAGDQDPDAHQGRRRGSAWLGSWLLRRPGLFQQVTTPHLLEGHSGPGNWTLELCHLTTSPFEAETLTQLLRHPELGLPWAPTVRTCSRVLLDGTQHRSRHGEHWARDDDRSGQIILDLDDPGHTVLDLRYHRDPVTLLHPAVRDAATARISHAVARHNSLRRLIGAEPRRGTLKGQGRRTPPFIPES